MHPSLPLDGRTLLGTPVVHNIRPMGHGKYFHLGFQAGLQEIKGSSKTLHLFFNVDGMPVTKGNQHIFLPILCKVRNNYSPVFPVGIYEGAKKPECFNDFMEEFINEINELLTNGITIKNTHFLIKIYGFIMDAPAASSMMYITPFNGVKWCSII